MFSENQILDTLRYTENGFYISTLKPEKGKNYFIKILTNNYSEISASSYIPTNLQITNIEQQDFAIEDNTGTFDGDIILPLSRLSITFEDNPDEKNYYEFKISIKSSWNDTISDILQSSFIYTYDLVITNEDILDFEPRIIPFSDTLFNGETKTIDFLYRPLWLQMSGDGEHNYYSYGKYRIFLDFRCISKEMYDYRKSLTKHLFNQQTDNYEILGDPVQMFSNIKNGYGIFAGYINFSDTIYVESSDIIF